MIQFMSLHQVTVERTSTRGVPKMQDIAVDRRPSITLNGDARYIFEFGHKLSTIKSYPDPKLGCSRRIKEPAVCPAASDQPVIVSSQMDEARDPIYQPWDDLNLVSGYMEHVNHHLNCVCDSKEHRSHSIALSCKKLGYDVATAI